jgi:hypothetical protein
MVKFCEREREGEKEERERERGRVIALPSITLLYLGMQMVLLDPLR